MNKLLIVLLAVVFSSCSSHKKEPAPPKPDTFFDCKTSCQNAMKLNCEDYITVPCTEWDQGCPSDTHHVSCMKWCTDTVKAGVIDLDFTCMSTVTSCKAFDGC